MKSKQHIITKLNELHSKFPYLTIRYKYDAYSQMHIVDIMPLSEYENNEEYKKYEAEIGYEFDNEFFPESVMFISSDSLVQIDNPVLVLEPITESNLDYDNYVKTILVSELTFESFEFNFKQPDDQNYSIKDSNTHILAA